MSAYLDLWHARIVGRFEPQDKKKIGERRLAVAMDFDDGTGERYTFSLQAPDLDALDFEIRVYSLHHRQRFGLRVAEVRDYLRRFGGVHVYDSGFHLPHYGKSESDWLGIEIDHSHRLSTSRLLPEDLQVPEGMQALPTLSRFFGVVNVNTLHEQEAAATQQRLHLSRHLSLQVTRDRLTDNAAYLQLRDAVRTAIDYYAMVEARRKAEKANRLRPIEPTREKVRKVEEVLAHHRESIPEPVFEELKRGIEDAITASTSEAEAVAHQIGLLAPLATAGMCALAYEHEIKKQFVQIEGLSEQIAELEAISSTPVLKSMPIG